MNERNQKSIHAIHKAIQLISMKWSFPIISQLLYRPYPFNQLKSKLQHISVTALIDTLRFLEKNHVIHHRVYSSKPLRMEYSLSEEGKEFIQVLLGIRRWRD